MKINRSCGWKVVSNVTIACLMLFIIGCTSSLSMLLSGGEIVKSNYVPSKILVTYKPVVLNNGKKAIYYLIDTSKGHAIYETTQGQRNSICSMHWDDAENDYFGCYIGGRDAWRYIVPKDRTKDAKRYHYRIISGFPRHKYINGGFEIRTILGVKKVIEKDPSAAVPIILSPK